MIWGKEETQSPWHRGKGYLKGHTEPLASSGGRMGDRVLGMWGGIEDPSILVGGMGGHRALGTSRGWGSHMESLK